METPRRLHDPVQRAESHLQLGVGLAEGGYGGYQHEQVDEEGEELADVHPAAAQPHGSQDDDHEQGALQAQIDQGLDERDEARQADSLRPDVNGLDADLLPFGVLGAGGFDGADPREEAFDGRRERPQAGLQIQGHLADRAPLAHDDRQADEEGHENGEEKYRIQEADQHDDRAHDRNQAGGDHVLHHVDVDAGPGEEVCAVRAVVRRHRPAQVAADEAVAHAPGDGLGSSLDEVALEPLHRGRPEGEEGQQRGGAQRGTACGDSVDEILEDSRLDDRKE